ncbi:MAG: nucleoside-diphosphate kinase [Duncaniella sp.]|nr:nucleoside-diphosphate kinase [Duncaniella sp.]
MAMQQTLIIFKPSAVERGLVGTVLERFERKGLKICGMKMMQLSEELLREHYAHLVDRPFFPLIIGSMTASPVIVMVLEGLDAIEVVRNLTGATNGRKAAPGTIRGDFSVSGQENIIHASSSPEDAEVEIKRFFKSDEIFDYKLNALPFLYSADEIEG